MRPSATAGSRRARSASRSRPGRTARAPRRRRRRDLVVLAAELGEQRAVLVEHAAPAGRASPSAGRTWTPSSSPCAARAIRAGAADHVVASGRAGDRDDHPLARLPAAGRCRGLAVLLERLVDPVGDPHQRELAERAEVALAEVVGERRRRPSPAGRCCRAPCAGAAPRASCRRARPGRPARTTASGIVSCCLMPVICSTTSFIDSRCCTFTRRDHVDAGVEELVDVLPALLVAGARARSCARARRRARRSGLRARTASTSISSNVAPR